jgi:hypothetical protein
LREEFRLRVFERVEVIGEWRKLHNEELNDLYSSPNIIWVIKSRRMRWAEHAAGVGSGEVYTGYWFGKLRKETTWKIQA